MFFSALSASLRWDVMKHAVYIGIGSNLGDRLGSCEKAIEHLKRHDDIDVVATSSWYETEAVTLNQEREPSYINGAIKISTTLSPQKLLESLKTIETQMGRPSDHPKWSARVIDLDILFYDDIVINLNPPLPPFSKGGMGGLIIPHPEIEIRWFVLKPLCDIAPDLIHPVLKKSVRELYDSALMSS